jgi:hypothetical protein
MSSVLTFLTSGSWMINFASLNMVPVHSYMYICSQPPTFSPRQKYFSPVILFLRFFPTQISLYLPFYFTVFYLLHLLHLHPKAYFLSFTFPQLYHFADFYFTDENWMGTILAGSTCQKRPESGNNLSPLLPGHTVSRRNLVFNQE